MNQAQALAKLRKFLGDGLGYRVDPKAPTGEEHEAAVAAAKAANVHSRALAEARDARQTEVLKADETYQRLKNEAAEARKAFEIASGRAHARRITVGSTSFMFFHVRAEGDNWDEVVAKVKEKYLEKT